MASYKTVLKPSVEKDLRFLPRSIVKRALAEVEALQDDPLPRQASKLQGEKIYTGFVLGIIASSTVLITA